MLLHCNSLIDSQLVVLFMKKKHTHTIVKILNEKDGLK